MFKNKLLYSLIYVNILTDNHVLIDYNSKIISCCSIE